MDQLILQDLPRIERKNVIRDSADKKDSLTYPRSLDVIEVTTLKDEYTQNAIKMAKHEEIKKEFMDSWKLDVKPLKGEMLIQMQKIRSKVDEITEDVYLISDQDAKLMGYYNDKGELVYMRPLLSDERQMSLVDKTKITGTSN